ncbi:MAG: site-specific DNA-methyltransferase [Rhodobacteraceae bacterium]|nr:site-specific DNA-methyltransferase [Paracoccaceae bacterium]
MDKLKMHSPDLTQDNIAKIRELFPGCVTEAASADGSVRLAVNFDQLRQELSESIIEGPQERYQLNWPGKREAIVAANAPIAKTFRPVRNESVDFDVTKNLFIEGDNLDALKLLQDTYLAKVKLIYIDPPYNTGSDFVYNDDFAEDNLSFLHRSNQQSEDGAKLTANTEANGRFHSDWLSMMTSRLRISRNLLSDDGVIFISIDDHERDNLKKLADEIFGEAAFVASIIWRKKASPDARSTVGSVHDYILCYVKNHLDPKSAIGKMALSEKRKASFSNPDNDPRGPWASVDMTGMIGRATKDQFFEVTLPSGRKIGPPSGRSWGLIEATFRDLNADGRIWFGASGDNVPRIKRFLSEVDGQTVPTYWGYEEVGSNEDASDELLELFNSHKVFDTPKPRKLLERIIEIGTSPSGRDLVLDFFAGSATTADAVLTANAVDGGNRKFIMVQMCEPVAEKSEAAKAGFEYISQISMERIRKAGKKLLQNVTHKSWTKDVGFRVLKIDTSNMADVYYTPDATNQGDLLAQVDSIKQGRTAEDLLFQVLVDWGVDLTLPIRRETVQGKTVLFVDENALVACFDTGITEELVKELAGHEPVRVVFRDTGFVSDAVKINVEQVFRQLSPGTEVKAI